MNDVSHGGIEKPTIVIVDYDPLWPEKFQKNAAIMARALVPKMLGIEN